MPTEKDWKVSVSIMLTTTEIEEIDRERGTKQSRSSYLGDVIRNRKKS